MAIIKINSEILSNPKYESLRMADKVMLWELVATGSKTLTVARAGLLLGKRNIDFGALIDAGFLSVGDGDLEVSDSVFVNKSDSKRVADWRAKKKAGVHEIKEEKKQTEEKIEKNETKIPYKEIVEIYHEELAMLPKVRRFESMKPALKRIWKEFEKKSEEKGDDAILEVFRMFFQHVASSKFLTGRKTEWKADLAWIIGPKNFEKVINGVYE